MHKIDDIRALGRLGPARLCAAFRGCPAGSSPSRRSSVAARPATSCRMQIILVVTAVVSLLIQEWSTAVLLVLLTVLNAVVGLRQAGKAPATDHHPHRWESTQWTRRTSRYG